MVDPRKVHYLGILGLLLALGAIGVLGPSTFFSSRQELQDAIDRAVGGGPAQAQLFMGLVIVPPTLALFLLLWGRNAIGWRRTAAADILMAALLLVVATVANPIVNSRFLSGSVIVALLVGSSRRVGTTRFSRQIGSAVLVAVLLVFPIADFARFADGGTSKEFGLDRTLFTGGDYDAFQQTMNGVRYVEVRGVSDGTQAIGAALFWVPRQAWAGKPEPTGVVVARDAGYTFLNLSSPAWLEGYVDFLWIGAFAFGLLLGMISARLDRGFYERTFSIWASLAPLYIGYQIIILRGTLMGVIPVLVLWALLTAAVTRRAPVGTSASESAW